MDGTPCYCLMKTIAGEFITDGSLSFRGILGTVIVKVLQNLLINLGFTDVYNLSGGYKEYKTEIIF